MRETPKPVLLPQLFADLAASSDVDPIERVVALTFEFDDRQLLNLVAGVSLNDDSDLNINRLRFLADCQPVVIYDASKTASRNVLPHFMTLLPVKASAFSCHHAKAYLVISRKTMRLVLGSFNLTRTGLSRNREVFADLLWNGAASAPRRNGESASVWLDFAGLLERGYQDHLAVSSSTDLASAVHTIRERIGHHSGGEQALVASGFSHLASGAALARIASLWNARHDVAPAEMLIVSPFFDRGESWVVDDFFRVVGVPRTVRIITDDVVSGAISKRHFGAETSATVDRHLNLISEGLGPSERQRIAESNDVREGSVELAGRALHAKVLVLCSTDGKNNLYYMGSANFTRKAWINGNQELGLAWFEDGNAHDIHARLRTALSATAGNSYETLPEKLPPREVDIDPYFAGKVAYPEFIRVITLHGDDASRALQFHFDVPADQAAALKDYEVRWGCHLVSIEGQHSQVFAWEEAGSVFHQRENLHFQPITQSGIPGYYLPFLLAPGLYAQGDLNLYPDPDAWLAYYLAPGHGGGGTGGMGGAGGTDDGDGAGDGNFPDRDKNVIIGMQRYLNLFAATEAALLKQAAVLAQSDFDAQRYQRYLGKPIATFLRLLEREYAQACTQQGATVADPVYLFKLGELSGVCQNIAALLPAARGLVESVQEKMAPFGNSRNRSMQIYASHQKNRARA